MPDQSANLTTIRDTRYWSSMYLSTPTEAEVLRGTVSAAPSEPALSLTYTNVSGTHTSVEQDMEVEVFRGGVSLGRVRVAPGGATSTVLQIEEVSRGRILITTGDEFRVYRSWRTRTRLVGATDALLRDSRVTVGDRLTNYRPVPVSGGGFAGFVDGSNIITVQFDAAGSYTVDPDSNGTRAYAWDVRDGTITVGTSTTAAITVTFPPGFRWIRLTVTDSTNSTTAAQYIPVWAHERTGTNAPRLVKVNSRTGDIQNGWACDFEVLDGSTPTNLPDGALVYLWAEEPFSFGAAISGRSHIKFVGYLTEDSSTTDPQSTDNQQRVEFRAISPLARLAQLTGFSQAVERVSVSSSWLQAAGLRTRVMMDYIVRHGSTLQVCHDFINNAGNYDYPAFYLQANTPYSQLQELVEAVDSVLTCDRLGRVLIYPDPVTVNTTTRNAMVTTLTLTEVDALNISGTRTHTYRYAQLEGRATTAADVQTLVTPVFSRAPGLAPADAPQFTERDRLIVSTQTELNERTGHRYAKENAIYYGLPTYENVQVTLRGGYDVFDFFQEWVKLNIASLYNARGVGWNANNQRYVVQSIAVEYDSESGASEVQLTLNAETIGYAGVFYQPPPDPQSQIEITPIETDFPWLADPIVIPDVSPILGGSPLRVYAVGGVANEIKRMVAFDFTTGTGTVEHMDASNQTTGAPLWAQGDPFDTKRFFVMTTTGLWKTDDRTAAAPSWTLVANNLTITGNASHICPYFVMSINRRGYIAAQSGNGLCTSFDYGVTWVQNSVQGALATSTSREIGFTFMVSPWNNPNASNQGWVYAYPPPSGLPNVNIFLNTNWGRGAWTNILSTLRTDMALGRIELPYKRANGVANKNDDNQLLYVFLDSFTTNVRMAVIRKNGTIDTEVVMGGDSMPRLGFNKRPLNAYTVDGRYFRWSGRDKSIYESTNSGADITSLSTSLKWSTPYITGYSTLDANGMINGWGNDRTIMLAFSTGNNSFGWDGSPSGGYLRYTPDAGVNWYNLATAFGFTTNRFNYAELANV